MPRFRPPFSSTYLGLSMWPHLFMKAYTAKDEKTLKQAIVMYPSFAIMLIPVLFIGFAGILQVAPAELGEADKILPLVAATFFWKRATGQGAISGFMRRYL